MRGSKRCDILSFMTKNAENFVQKNKGHLVALLTVLVWGTTFINTKILLQSLTPTALLLLRFILGYLAFLFMARKPIGFHGWKREALFAAAGLTGITLYFLVEHMALQNTSAGNVCVIVSTAPLFTALLKRLTDPTSKKLPMRFFLGFVLAIGGIALITFGGQQVHLSPIGDLTALLSALMWALYNLTTERLERAGESAMAVTRRIFFYGILFTLPFIPLTGTTFPLDVLFTPMIGLNLLFLGILASAICFASWNYAVQQLGPVATSIYIYLQPVGTILLGVLILHERLTLTSCIGILLTFAGLLLS